MQVYDAGSSNGRTPAFGAGYEGSNPSPAGMKNRIARVEIMLDRTHISRFAASFDMAPIAFVLPGESKILYF